MFTVVTLFFSLFSFFFFFFVHARLLTLPACLSLSFFFRYPIPFFLVIGNV